MYGTLSKIPLLAFLAASILAVTAVAFAQQGSGRNLRITESAAGRVDRLTALTNFLVLTPDQREQAEEIFGEEDPITRPLAGQLKQAVDALRAAEETGATDSEIDQSAQNVANVFAQLLAAESKADSRVYALLTAEQKQKLDELPIQPSLMPASLVLSVPAIISRSSSSGGQ